jgi:hypothetical protein
MDVLIHHQLQHNGWVYCEFNARRLTLPVPSAAIVANGTANGINAAGMATFNLEASNFMDCKSIKIKNVF